MPKISSAYNAGASAELARHTNWASALGGVLGGVAETVSSTDKLLNSIRAQEDEKMTRWVSLKLEGAGGDDGERINGLMTDTYNANLSDPEGMLSAYEKAWNDNITVDAIMQGASVSRRAAERWMREYAPDMKNQYDMAAQDSVESAAIAKIKSQENPRQTLIMTNPDTDFSSAMAEVVDGYDATGVVNADPNGDLDPRRNPLRWNELAYEHSYSKAQKHIEDSIASGLSREDAIEYGKSLFSSNASQSTDFSSMQDVSELTDKIEAEIGSYYDQKDVEITKRSSDTFADVGTDLLNIMYNNGGHVTRDDLLSSAQEHGADIIGNERDRENYFKTAKAFGLLASSEATMFSANAESSLSPEDQFTRAAKDRVGTEGYVTAKELEGIAEGVSLDTSTEAGTDAYESGLGYVAASETKRDTENIVKASEFLSSYTVDWEKDTGVAIMNYSYASGQIDEDTSYLSAYNKAAIERYNNLLSADQGGPKASQHVTTLAPLAERVMNEYGITSPEAQSEFMEFFYEWEKKVSDTKPPTAVESDVWDHFYDISLSDDQFHRYLTGMVTSQKISPSFAIDILKEQRQSLLKDGIGQLKGIVESYINGMDIEDFEKAKLKYEMITSLNGQNDMSMFYLRNAGKIPDSELQKAIEDKVDTAYRINISHEATDELDQAFNAAFIAFKNPSSWKVGDYKLDGTASANIFGFEIGKDTDPIEIYTAYIDGNLPSNIDRGAIKTIYDGITNRQMSSIGEVRDAASHYLFGRDYSDIKKDEDMVSTCEAVMSIAMTESNMTQMYRNYFGDEDWKTCRIDGDGLAYMNKAGVLVVLPYKKAIDGDADFLVYKFNNYDDEFQAVWGKDAKDSSVLSLSEYIPASYDASKRKKRSDPMSDQRFRTAINTATAYRQGSIGW